MYSIRDLTEIEIFPENKNFIYYQNQFLLGKTNQNVDTFDALIYARNDLEEAIIPPQVQIIKERSFYFHNKLKSLIFPDDSKISKIEYDIIYACSIERLRLSPSIEYIDTDFYISLDKVKSIEISPKNLIFSLFENKCILKKSSKESTVFDQLVYCRRDVKEIVIPSYIKTITYNSFNYCDSLKSLIFEPNSSIDIIEKNAFFSCYNLLKIVLPASLKKIGEKSFDSLQHLESIQFLGNGIGFEFGNCCFRQCNNLKKILFPNAIELNFGKYGPFGDISSGVELFVNKNTKLIGFEDYQNRIKFIDDSIDEGTNKNEKEEIANANPNEKEEIANANPNEKEEIANANPNEKEEIANANPNEKEEIANANPNEKEEIANANPNEKEEIANANPNEKEEIANANPNEKEEIANANPNEKEEIANANPNEKEEIANANPNEKEEIANANPNEKEEIANANPNEKEEMNININEETDIDKKREQNTSKDVSLLLSHIRFLESRLCKYEKVDPFDLEAARQKESKEQKPEEKNIFIGEEDEEFQEVIEKIGEGASSIAYKIIDKRYNKIMCKKVLKVEEGKTTFKKLQNSVKEFEALSSLNNPCICEAYGFNLQEKVKNVDKKGIKEDEEQRQKRREEDYEYEYDEEKNNDDDDDDSNQMTTVALFIEFLPYKLKDALDKKMLNNTLKVRVALEVAFGMSYIHSKGMMHRDLKIENIMLNYAFEAKIIDFDLVGFIKKKEDEESATKGVGTFAYMSPEMANEEDYDNKTDVYSYGIVLFVVFAGHLPKQNLKDKMTNSKPIRFPHSSPSISKYCIELIKKCTEFESSKRPSFNEIIMDMKNHSFGLAEQIDDKIIYQRYENLISNY